MTTATINDDGILTKGEESIDLFGLASDINKLHYRLLVLEAEERKRRDRLDEKAASFARWINKEIDSLIASPEVERGFLRGLLKAREEWLKRD